MKLSNHPWMLVLVALVALQAVVIANLFHRQRSGQAEAALNKVLPAKLDPIAGTRLMRVTLTEKAAERLGVKTVPLADWPKTDTGQRSLPYASLLYDLDGTTWVYKQVAPLAYERHQVKVASIKGDSVFVTDGPPPGTQVVVQGAIEIFGTETKVGH